MAQVLKQLGQLRPADTNAASLYSPGASTETIIKTIVVCNQTASAATYRLFHDDDGTTYDESTALAFDINLGANSTDFVEVNIMANDSTGNVAVRTGTNSAITFTAYGTEYT